MARLETLPNILWKVENLWGNEKKCSSVLHFLGMTWKLKLLFLPESGGVKVKLILKRLSAPTLSHDANFNVDTCLLKQYGAGEFFRQNLYATLGYREWCIWSQFKTDVEKQEHVYYRNSIVFLVVITPGDKWSTLLQTSYTKKSEDSPVPPCLQSLTGQLDALFDSDLHSDVVVVCGGRRFRAHRALLSARSQVFEAMFRCDMRESREGTVTVTDVEPDVLEQFLRYLYTGEVGELDAAAARRLYAVADKYAVEALKERCALAVVESYRSGVETHVTRNAPVTFVPERERLRLRKKELTKQLLLGKEWRTLAEEYPRLAADMCTPLMEVEEEEHPPAPPTPQEEPQAAAENS